MKTFDGISLISAQHFSRQVAGALVHCNYKISRMTSGKRTHESVKRIADAIVAAGGSSTPAAPKTSTASVKRTAAVSLPVSESIDKKQTAWELYGVSPPSKRRALKKGYTPAVFVSSSEEESMEISEKINDLAEEKILLEWFDQQTCCMKRTLESGKTAVAQCFDDNGFLSYKFPNEEPKQTEIPALALQVLSKPGIGMKKPAAAMKKPSASSGSKLPLAAPPPAPPCPVLADDTEVEVPVHNVRITCGKEPERSYITACQCEDGKHRMQLIVQYTLKRDGTIHHQKAVKAKQYIEEQKLTFDQARQIRQLLPQ